MNIKIQLDDGQPTAAKVKARKRLHEGDVVFVSLEPKKWLKVIITALLGADVYQAQQLS